ncbi:transmembrane protein, putative (macronuclear) [Tetrahymena thermophila SB210]|uniref:Transmembrane protein, putative n=1 Tax=Tetrahymena thermophila (strain SB210) TaxID=312017 RepID=W7XGJ1_TETTS|nr:transmembrane protein, putative [Tetrahymena thermophila SB210]EWS73271.1 transmembrane protein, putative [Tetrahymena thermophila SB210]|eukprot:XP_012654180.1 transmembrane protein, putative [Tetrahymena thermophila SB210]
MKQIFYVINYHAQNGLCFFIVWIQFWQLQQNLYCFIYTHAFICQFLNVPFFNISLDFFLVRIQLQNYIKYLQIMIQAAFELNHFVYFIKNYVIQTCFNHFISLRIILQKSLYFAQQIHNFFLLLQNIFLVFLDFFLSIQKIILTFLLKIFNIKENFCQLHIY